MMKRFGLFSVGFSIEQNKLTDCYYDLLASEARQTSYIAIAKKDITYKHWHNLGRTLTTYNGYKGLISWSGTSFEYLMPNINMEAYPASIISESSKFMIMSQKEYGKILEIPWGISEAAFNLKDLNNNYQYKAFGIPWLGLKRGLSEEIVTSSYGTILAITDDPIAVLNNIKQLEKMGMYSKYGFYESIDFTPNRVVNNNGRNYSIVKTYMAHHQGLILTSINNYINNNIIQKRFMENSEMMSSRILLEEKMPNSVTIKKEENNKKDKVKYLDYEDYYEKKYDKINDRLNISNTISNDKYMIFTDINGNGFSKYKNLLINRYKKTEDLDQGIIFYIKNINSKRIWTNIKTKYLANPDNYGVTFAQDKNIINRIDGDIKTTSKIIVDAENPVEIRKIEFENLGNIENTLEVTCYFEPVLSESMQDYSHKAFNNLFLRYKYIDELNAIIIKRQAHTKDEKELYLAVTVYSNAELVGEPEYEIDKEKFVGRGNMNLPEAILNSIPLSKKIGYTVNPIVAIKNIIKIPEKEKTSLSLIISISENERQAIINLKKYLSQENIELSFKLSKVRSETENRFLGVKASNIEVYQKLISYLLLEPKVYYKELKNIKNITIDGKDKYSKTEIWKYGISGDLPIVLITVNEINDIDIIKEMLVAYEYLKTKNIIFDLVILNEEKQGYESYVKEAIHAEILNKNFGYLMNIKGGIFVINNIAKKEEKKLLEERANIILDGSKGSLKEQINDLEENILDRSREEIYESKKETITANIDEKNKIDESIEFSEKKLKYFNEYGGFIESGKEYIIKQNKQKRLPTVWSNIICNKEFGSIVTDAGGGYTWNKNSKLNKITSMSNDQVLDKPSEIIYVKDKKTNLKWSMTVNPMPDNNNYYTIFGFGYVKYIHTSSSIKQTIEQYIPNQDNVKVNLIHLENMNPEKKSLKIIYYIKPIMGEDEIETVGNISINYDNKSNIIMAKNMENKLSNNILFVSSSEKIKTFTGNENNFLRDKNLSNTDSLDRTILGEENSYGTNGIIAIMVEVEIDAMSEKIISFILGEEKNKAGCQDLGYKYSDINNCKSELINVKKYWEEITTKVQVDTPVESNNILINGWLIYQTLTARVFGRSGFYQSGGAYGFRDQLQDMLAVKYFNTNIVRDQIIKHARHQFIEGDVEHWWHDDTERGIRTKISDDRLFLVYVTIDYIEYTGDYEILNEEIPYLDGKILDNNEEDRYDRYIESKEKESLYMHLIRAIEISLNFGKNGLPKIGTGDWNDGFNKVGKNDIGESVWLGFFLYDVLTKIIKICEKKNDIERIEKYKNIKIQLKKVLNSKAWDGRWYKRAYMDNGEELRKFTK